MPVKKSLSSIGSAKRQKSEIQCIDLKKFCFKKVYEIVFITEYSTSVSNILDRIVTAGKKYDKISSVSFITYEDVINFIKDFYEEQENIDLPDYIKKEFRTSVDESMLFIQENMSIPAILMAKLIKIKIIQTMYDQYVKQVEKMEQTKRFDDELNELMLHVEISEGKKGAKNKGKSKKGGKKDKGSKSSSTKDKKSKDKDSKGKKTKDKKTKSARDDSSKAKLKIPTHDDVTKIPLKDNEIITKSNYDDEIWFYVLKGFYDPYLFDALISIDVPVSIVMEISLPLPVDEHSIEVGKFGNKGIDREINIFWDTLSTFLYGPIRNEKLENTILMRYTPTNESTVENENIEITWLKQLTDVLWNLNQLKLKHLNYIKNLKLNTLEHFGDRPFEYPTDFKVYNKFLDTFPSECVGIPLILDCLLEEIDNKFEIVLNGVTERSVTDQNSDYSKKEENFENVCECPFSFNYFIPCKKRENSVGIINKTNTYQTHENNDFEKIEKSYKEIGRRVYDIQMTYLKKIPPVVFLSYYDLSSFKKCDHTHDRSDTGCTIINFSEDELLHYISLFALFEMHCHQQLSTQNNIVSEINSNLKLNGAVEEYKDLKPKLTDESVFHFATKSFHSKFVDVNLYEMKEVANYNWAEIMSTAVMLQELSNSNEKYICIDHVYCDDLDCLFLRYHNNLDAFGINTRVWHKPLRTPVCFRDFCRYICDYDINWLIEEEEKCYVEEKNMSENNLKQNVCKGAKKLATSASNHNYLDLISARTVEEDDNILKKGASKDILDTIIRYPKSEVLREFCMKEEGNQTFVGYDLGTKQLEVNGCTTTFQSHDGVRLSVDTTHFLGFKKNLNITISTDGYDLIMHRTQDRSHFLLQVVSASGIRVVINNTLAEEEVSKEISQISQISNISPNLPSISEVKSTLFDATSGSVASVLLEEQASTLSSPRSAQRAAISKDIATKSSHGSRSILVVNYSDTNAAREEELKEIFAKHFALIPKSDTGSGAYIISQRNFMEMIEKGKFKCLPDELLRALLNGISNEFSLYKLSSTVVNNRALVKKSDCSLKIPIFTIVKRILQKEAKKETCKRFIRSYVAKEEATNDSLFTSPKSDLCITLPTGLTIKIVPSEICKGSSEIKQTYLLNTHPKNIENEVYRLFTRNGLILIRYPDGRIDLLKSNGEIIQFEKPCNNGQAVSEMKFGVEIKNCFKLPTCKSLYNCQKELNTILTEKYEDSTVNHVSRRAHLQKQKASLEQVEEEIITCNLPYSKYSVLKFDGKRISINFSRVTQYQETFITHEFDHRLEERFYTRDDGMKCVLEKEGKLCIQFPDRSRITSWYVIEPELICISDKMGGWVSILLNFKFEHPNYATVIYPSNSNDMEIIVNDEIVIKRNDNDMVEMKLGSDLVTTITEGVLHYRKICDSCNSLFTCSVDIGKFTDSNVNKEKDILVAADSYNKIFRVRDLDNYRINKCYIPGPFNSVNCDHYHNMNYEKLYALKRDNSGLLLWSNKNVDKKMNSFENRDDTEILTRKNIYGFKHIEFLKNIYLPYNERFINNDLVYDDLGLSKYKLPEAKAKELAYLIYREVYEMTNIQKFMTMLTEIKEFVEEMGGSLGENLRNQLVHLIKGTLQNVDDSIYFSDIRLSTSTIEVIDDRPICDCIQIKFTYKEKIDQWKRQCQKYKDYIHTSFVPLYFMSEYYKPVNKKNT